MPRPVTSDDVAVRTYELPNRVVAPSDAAVVMDGPASGPVQIAPHDLISGSLARIVSLAGNPPPGSTLLVQPPTGSAQRFPIEDVLGQGSSYYLGPSTTVPTTNSQGLPVQPGNTYFDLNTNQMMVLGTDMVWRLAGQPVPAAARRYVWSITGTVTSLPPMDDYGNTLSYDVAFPEQLGLWINGARQIGGTDYVLDPALVLIVPVVAGDIVEILVHVPPVADYAAAPVAIDTSLWVPNGVTVAFPLKDQSGSDVIPASARGADVWLLASPAAGPTVPAGVWRLLAPVTEYGIAGATITFVQPPPTTALLQMTVWQLDPQARLSLLAVADFALDTSFAGALIIGVVSGLDVTVPSASALGPGFWCDFLADGFTITLHFPGGSTVVLTDGQTVRLITANGKLRVGLVTTTVVKT